MAVELVVEGEKALQVATLGVQGGLRLAGNFGLEVEFRQSGERRFRGLDKG
jgi:hypothetical protein